LLELQRAGYRLVLVSNQDGLGTPSFPEPSFREPQDFLRNLLASQGIWFDAEFFCPHSRRTTASAAKPRTDCSPNSSPHARSTRKTASWSATATPTCSCGESRYRGIARLAGRRDGATWATIVARLC
jgi:imidazoleglycerol-phosphate dehydratase/histidinol-phosphatase